MSEGYIRRQNIHDTVHNTSAEGNSTYTKLNVSIALWKTQQSATVTDGQLLVTWYTTPSFSTV